MHLFVESNFVLELVLQQEQVAACETLLAAAEQGRISLVLPAFCLMEPVYRLGAAEKQRKSLVEEVNKEVRQAIRERGVTPDLAGLERNFTTLLAERDLQQQQQVIDVSTRVSRVVKLLPLTANTWGKAAELRESTNLTLPDALVGASILLGIEALGSSTDKLFVTRDRKGFDAEVVMEQMRQVGCASLFNFEHAVQRLRLY